MKLNIDKRPAAKITVHASVEDGPIHPQQYSDTKKFRAAEIAITYGWNGERWDVGGAYSIDISGPVQLKAGGDSKATHTGRPEWNYVARRPADEYAWVSKAIGILRPSGRPSTVHGSFEVDS